MAIGDYPIVIVQDRYQGVYAGGAWIAIAEADAHAFIAGPSRVRFIMHDGPGGGDTDAMVFWHEPPDWVAVGNTPDTALAALRKKIGA